MFSKQILLWTYFPGLPFNQLVGYQQSWTNIDLSALLLLLPMCGATFHDPVKLKESKDMAGKHASQRWMAVKS